MHPGRSRYEPSDLTSSAYLRTTASYADFLEKQGRNIPPMHPEKTLGLPPNEDRVYPSRASSWREDPHPPRGPFPPRPEYREQGWRNEPSWRNTNPYQPSSSRTESWVKRRDVKPPPAVDPQRYIAPASEEQRRHIAPAANAPSNYEMWRDGRALPTSNWRKDPVEAPPTRHYEPPVKRAMDEDDRNGRIPEEFHSPRELPPSPKTEQSSFYPTFSESPAERHPPRRMSPVPHQASRESHPSPSQKSPKVPRIESPIRNRILPAEEVGPVPDEFHVQKWGESPPKRRSQNELYEEGKPSWRNMEPTRSREDSWTVQYKKRVEAQKAAAMMRDIERRKGPETLPGPSFDLGIPNIYGRDYQHRPINDPMDPSAGDDPYNVPREEPSSAGRKFFFADPHQRPNVEDRYGEIRRKDSFGEPEYRKPPKDFYPDARESKPPTTRKREPSCSEPPINPNDFVEEFSDDDWNELGALVKNQNRKRLSGTQEITTPNKKSYTASSSISESGFSNYSGPTTKEMSQSSLSFFREELPSVRSAKGFSGYPTEYLPQRNEFSHHQRWESGTHKQQHNGDGHHGIGFR